GELHDRLATDGTALVRWVIEEIVTGTVVEREQDHAAATIAPKLSRESAVLDWSQSGPAIARRINGLSPWPRCRVQLVDADGTVVGRITLLRARAVEAGESKQEPGRLTDSGTAGAGDGGAVEILDVQPEGKRPMSLNDYRRGNRWAAGLVIQSG